MSILAAHEVPYAATLSVAHPEDFARKLKTALELDGLRFLLLHSPCPTGWKSDPADSVELVRIAVDSGLFPLYEVWNGSRYRINERPVWSDPSDYFERQDRFSTAELDVAGTIAGCRERYARLEALATAFPYQDTVF